MKDSMTAKKIMVVYGTRPELIKLAPLIIALKQRKEVELSVVSSGQHKEMLNPLEKLFDIKPDFSLNVMRKNQSINSVVSSILEEMDLLFKRIEPSLVFVQGDTATVLATAMAAYFCKIEVAHVEAGLRSFNLDHPFPEEFNRRTVSILANYNFVPTQLSYNNLKNEGVEESRIFLTGNTVVDALHSIKDKLTDKKSEKKQILITAHRRENHNVGIANICKAITRLIDERNDIQFLWPVHPNPNVQQVVMRMLSTAERVKLVQPLEYVELLEEMKKSYLIWTDSGGIQEEAPSFKKPVLILREVTERPEVVAAGFGQIVGTNIDLIISKTNELLNSEDKYEAMTTGENPFGDGTAAEKILNFINL